MSHGKRKSQSHFIYRNNVLKSGMELKLLFPQAKSSGLVRGLFFDSRKVTEGSLFFALKGSLEDGHRHLESACKAKPLAVVVMDSDAVPKSFAGEVIVVSDTRKALAKAARCFYEAPSQQLKMIGVTGTNGKTTTVYMLDHLFKKLHKKIGVMGTIDHHLGSQVWKSGLTTPDVIGVQARLREFVDLGAQYGAMEVSSHALDQERVSGVEFDVALWTNLTRDHLDYHKSEAEYFHAKEKLFKDFLSDEGFALVNGDAENLKEVKVREKAKLYHFGACGDFRFSQVKESLSGVSFYFESLGGQKELVSLMSPGLHNVYNAVGAMATACCLGHSFSEVCEALKDFKGAPGRLELVHESPYVFVDYAHTPDALSSSLSSLKRLTSEGQRLIAVFGFGGDRDKGKRPLMLEEGLRWADQVILTSDNPRSEDPEEIIEDAFSDKTSDLKGSKILTEVDRKEGIHRALQMAKPNDVILIAGKGHEDYQILGDQVLHFSDQEVVKEYFS